MLPMSHADAEACAKALHDLSHVFEARAMSAERMRIYLTLLGTEPSATASRICAVIQDWMLTRSSMAYPCDLLGMLRTEAQNTTIALAADAQRKME